MTTKCDAIVNFFGMTEDEAREFLLNAGEDPDEVLDEQPAYAPEGDPEFMPKEP